MKEEEKRMKVQSTTVYGRVVKIYELPLADIEDLNLRYEEVKNQLNDFSRVLVGRLESELEFTQILQSTKIYKDITLCMEDYINSVAQFNLFKGKKDLHILSCWVNDMEEGEYNPPHTHHDLRGWSTVMFLKVPEFVNDAKGDHKYKDGHLGFIGCDGIGTNWYPPVVGDFYIFEAKHQHCVMPFKPKTKGEIRRSLSFNFVNSDDIK